VDQHLFVFNPTGNKIYICNDGGIYRCDTSITPIYTSLNNNLFIMQFYTAAIAQNNNTFMGGSQDNSTTVLSISGLSGLGNGAKVYGTGDGAFCHFDDTLSNFITADQHDAITAHFIYNGGNDSIKYIGKFYPITVPVHRPKNWQFVNPTELDRINNRLYVAGGADTIYVINNVFSPTSYSIQTIVLSDLGGYRISYLKLSPNDNNRLYIGTENGRFIKGTISTIFGLSISTSVLVYGANGSWVSSIDVLKNGTSSDTDVAFAFSNYGVGSIYHNSDVNSSNPFSVLDGIGGVGLPNELGNIPVRTVLFAPSVNTQGIKLLIGTDLGIYTTDLANSTSTQWKKFPINRGMPNVRVDMLKLRSDNMLVAATFGRGLMRSDMFCTQKINFTMNNPGAAKGCAVTFTDASMGYPTGTYTRRWEVREGTTLLPYSSMANTFSIPRCIWNPDMTVYLKMTDATGGTVYSRIGKPIYYMTGAYDGVLCPTCTGSTNRQSSSAINIYPNPSQDGVFHIENADLIQELSVFDISGRAISFSREEETLRIENVVTGVYFYKILQNDGNVLTGKLLVE
jgi:Secretion system C-terminal sorting domain